MSQALFQVLRKMSKAGIMVAPQSLPSVGKGKTLPVITIGRQVGWENQVLWESKVEVWSCIGSESFCSSGMGISQVKWEEKIGIGRRSSKGEAGMELSETDEKNTLLEELKN